MSFTLEASPRFHTHGSLIGGEEEQRVPSDSTRFGVWIRREGDRAFVIVEPQEDDGVVLDVIVEDVEGTRLYTLADGSKDKSGIVSVPFAEVVPATTIERRVSVTSQTGTETFEILVEWRQA